MLYHKGHVYVWTNGCVVCERMNGLRIHLLYLFFYVCFTIWACMCLHIHFVIGSHTVCLCV